MIFTVLAVVTLPYSIKWCSAAIALLTFNWLLEGDFNHKWQQIKKNRLIWLFSVLYILHVLGLLFTQDTANGLFNLEKKLSLFIFPVVLGTSRVLSDKEIKIILDAFILTCFGAVLISISYALFGPKPTDPVHLNFDYLNQEKFLNAFSGPTETWSMISYIGLGTIIQLHPTYFSLYIAFSISLLAFRHYGTFQYHSIFKKVLLIIMLLCLITTLIFLSSRIMLLSFLMLVFFVSGFLIIRPGSHFKGVVFSIAIVLFVVLMIFINPVTHFRFIQEPLNTGFSYPETATGWNSWNLRVLEWRSSWNIVRENWLVGVGTGDVSAALDKEYDTVDLHIFDMRLNAHNQYLQTALALGLIGASILVLTFIKPAYAAFKEQAGLYLTFIFLIAMCCLTESMLETQKGVVFYSFFNSLLIFQVYHQKFKKYA
ncbi:O-Antigen Polymerase family [Fulvivirga imtechensis AK7]|uniref:O-Antigen Polymerase family n=1 Tax=Fulvivirga imtechensis AK7 TaxID=1237149 RepID=L8JUI9_9BACT|nr:O-Antigen Polymerase family [Fulvivirga imtechensis AK7]